MRARSLAPLGVHREQNPPARVRHRHHVVVAAVDVEGLGGQGPGADVKNSGQALSRDRVQDLLHQDEPLAGGEVGDAPAREGKPFAGGRRGMFGLQLEEEERLAPEILLAVGLRHLVPGAHVGGRGDRVGAGALGDVGLDPDHRLRAVGRRGKTRKPGSVPGVRSAAGTRLSLRKYSADHWLRPTHVSPP